MQLNSENRTQLLQSQGVPDIYRLFMAMMILFRQHRPADLVGFGHDFNHFARVQTGNQRIVLFDERLAITP